MMFDHRLVRTGCGVYGRTESRAREAAIEPGSADEVYIESVSRNLIQKAVGVVSAADSIERALRAARLSQHDLAARTGLSQPTVHRIVTGKRVAKMPEILAIAEATGHTVAQLAGSTTVADRMRCAARATNGSGMIEMRAALLHFMELNDYLDDQAIP